VTQLLQRGQACPEARPAPEHEQQASDPLLSIGVFARRSRLSLKALRLYDRLGVLVPACVDQESGYRRYRQSQLGAARLVATLRRLDMPLARVAAVVAAPGPEGAALVGDFWAGVERRLASQRELVAHLQHRLRGGQERIGMYEILQRHVPEQQVLTEQRHVRVPELPAWLNAAMTRLVAAAGAHGGVTGPAFVVYHGEVNEDGDGPVEVCVPIDPAGRGASDTAMRREAAHDEAYVRLKKAQVDFPQILTAYDAVAQWISANGRTHAGPPREVYFADFEAATAEDEVCDVAFPVR
jgi:DNA-binding transcriptional MerR regulator